MQQLWWRAFQVVLIFVTTPAYATMSLTQQEQSYLQNKGEIVFISQSQYPPFEFITQDGEREGMCIELSHWIATELGFRARFVDASFVEAQQAIQDRRADVLTSFFYSTKRDRLFDFSDPMFFIPATIFVAADRPDIKNLKDLQGKTVAIQKGDYAEDYLRERGIEFRVRHTDNFAAATELVIQGQADAIIGDEQIVLYYLYSHNQEKKLKKIGAPLYVGENSMAAAEGETILIGILNKGIRLAAERGVLARINDKWLGVSLPQRTHFFLLYRWYIGGAALTVVVLFSIIWAWNRSLRREVDLRTRSLRENENFLDRVIEHIPNMLFIKKADDLTFVKFNRAGEQLTGFSREELYGRSDYDFFPPEQAEFFVRKDRAALAQGQPLDIPEEMIQTREHGERKLHTQKIPILDEQGQAVYLLGISEDITDRLAMEEARRVSDERLRAAIAAIDEGFVVYDADDRLAICNQKYREMYAPIAEELKPGARFSDLVESYGRYLYADETQRQNWVRDRIEGHRRGANAELKTLSGRWIKLAERKTSDGSTVGIRVDITSIKESEQKLREALKEKETLLKEVHHRVKNNMQVICSLLSLQRQSLTAPELIDVFNEAANRIHAMALIHETIYREESYARINALEYLQRLTTYLTQAMVNHHVPIIYAIQADDIELPIEVAVPFGLIVTEIITNAIKYAFPDRSSGKIDISLTRLAGDQLQLRVSDNGVGLATGINPDRADSLGMQLIKDITERQLEGTWMVDDGTGVSWIIVW